MANDFSHRPIKLDTAMSGGAGLNRPLRVVAVRLIGGTTASSFTIVEPLSGKTLAQGQTAANSDTQVDFAVPVTWRDFKLSDIAGTGALVVIFTR